MKKLALLFSFAEKRDKREWIGVRAKERLPNAEAHQRHAQRKPAEEP
jgi:hypothetical protein